MEVNILTMQKLFGSVVRYQIPTFQRPYVWNKEDQWEPLWNDVRNTAEIYMENNSGTGAGSRVSLLNQSRAHFLGAVVVQQQMFPAGEIGTRLVIDGQQRLTTSQLLLDAIQEVMERLGHVRIAKRMSSLVLNDDAFVDDEDDVFKVWPTLNDRDAFRHAMHNSLPTDKHEDSLIVQAHNFFKLEVEHWLTEVSDESEVRADALEKTVVHLLELVVIDLHVEDEPHIIFETLNARGTPLLQSDLIKNMVLYEAGKTNVTSDSEDALRLWGFTDDWWRSEVRRGRITSPRIDVFLNYWLTMRTQEEIGPDRVSAEFRAYTEKINKPIESVAFDIRRVGETYRALEQGKDEFETFHYRRSVMQAGTLMPALLWLFSSDMPDDQRRRAVRALESYTVRRMICRMTTSNYNQLFLGLVSTLEEVGAIRAGDTVVEYLAGQTAYANLWPDDRVLEDAFLTLPLYWSLTRGRLRFVLEAIEEELRTNMAESQAAPRGLTIEHIMPQKWQANWPLPADATDVKGVMEKRDRRARIVHSIGNLTLVNDRLNASLSNAAWEDKQKTLSQYTVLYLNKKLLEDAPAVWNEEAIANRARTLSKMAARAWPSAEGMRRNLV